MKNNQYKLLINNQQKQIIKEADFSLEDTSRFLEDLLNTGTNLIKATVISLGAMWEHSVMAYEVVGFASLENINKRFLEKINEANKLYNDAVPESVRGDVDFLFNINNPAIFIGKKVIDLAVNRETREMYIPFAWSLRYIFSGEFFKNDVKDFGKLFGETGFNNIIWYKGWFYRKLIFNPIQDLKKAIDNGLLSKSGINSLKNLDNLDAIIKEYPTVAAALRAFKAFETYHSPSLEFYDFCQRWNGEKIKRLMSISYYIHEKDDSIRFQYGDIETRLKKLQEEASSEKDVIKKQKIEEKIEELKNQLTEFENITDNDSDGTEFSIKDIMDNDKPIELDDIKVIGDVSNPKKTAIEQQIEDLQQELGQLQKQTKSSTNLNDFKVIKEKTRELTDLLVWKEHLQRKYKDKYADITDQSLATQIKDGSNSIDDIKKRKEKVKKRLKQLDEKIRKNSLLSKNLEDERAQLVAEFKEDFQNTAARIFKAETQIIPNIIKVFTGDEIYNNLASDFDAKGWETLKFLGQVIGATLPPELIQAYEYAKNLASNLPKVPTIPGIPGGRLPWPFGSSLSLQLTVVNESQINVTWSIKDAPNVTIEYDTDSTFKTSTTITSTSSPASITGLKDNTRYFFKIKDNAGKFAAETANATTPASIATGPLPPPPPPAPVPTPTPTPTTPAPTPAVPSPTKKKIKKPPTATRPGRPIVKEYVLKINDVCKILIENVVQSQEIDNLDLNDQMNDLKNIGLNSIQPNGAEEVILKNVLNNKKINKYTKQWIEASTLIKKSAGSLSYNQSKDIFLKMVDLSSNFFDKLQIDFMKSMEEAKNEKSEVNKKINSELNSKYGFELTPVEIVKKNHFNFQLLCYTYRIYAVAYLSNIQTIFEENDFVLKLLKNVSSEELNISLGKLKQITLNEVDSILKDETLKKFEKVNDDLKEILGEETQTYVDFKEQKEQLFKLIKDTKQQLKEFISQIERVLKDIQRLPEAQKLQFLIESITSYIDTNEKNIQKVYTNFLPGLNKMQKAFKDLKDNAAEMDRNYALLLPRLDDKILFSKIYDDNFLKFDAAYKKCIKFTGLTSRDAPLSNSINSLKKIKEEYKEKLENVTEEAQELMQQRKQKKAKKNNQEAVMTINNGQKEINPITTTVEDEE